MRELYRKHYNFHECASGWECEVVYKGKRMELDASIPNQKIMITIPVCSNISADNYPKCPDCNGMLKYIHDVIT